MPYIYKLKNQNEEIFYYVCNQRDDVACLNQVNQNQNLLTRSFPNGYKIIACSDVPITLLDSICTDVAAGGTTTIYIPTTLNNTTTTTVAIPSWLSKVGYSYDTNSGGFSSFVQTSADIQVMVEQTGANGAGWVSGVFYQMSSDTSYPAYTRRFNFFNVSGQNTGIKSQLLQMTVKNAANNQMFTVTFIPTNTPFGTPVDVPLSNSGGGSTTSTTSGGSNTTIAPPTGFNYLPLPSSTQPSDNKVRLVNGRMKLERWLDYGGSICHISEYNGPNLVNVHDWGRQVQVTLYGYPNPFLPPGVPYRTEWLGVGFDPIEAGSTFNQGGEILAYGQQDGMHYIKQRAKHWHLNNYPSEAIYETWTKFISENVVRTWYKVTIDRVNFINPDPNRYPAREQEMPCCHPPISYNRIAYYAGQNPWTDAPITRTQLTPTLQINSLPLAENWIACENPSTGRGYGIVSPDTYKLSIRQYGQYDDGEYGSDSAYFSSMVLRHLDPQGVLYETFDVVVGSPEEVRSHAKALPKTDNRPNFNFTTSRHDMTSMNGNTGPQNPNGTLVVTHQNMQIVLFSPSKPFKADDVNNITFVMKNNSPETLLRFAWKKPGQFDTDGIVDQNMTFVVPNNGNFNTVTLNVGNIAAWNDTIIYWKIEQVNSPENTPVSGRSWEFDSIIYS